MLTAKVFRAFVHEPDNWGNGYPTCASSNFDRDCQNDLVDQEGYCSHDDIMTELLEDEQQDEEQQKKQAVASAYHHATTQAVTASGSSTIVGHAHQAAEPNVENASRGRNSEPREDIESSSLDGTPSDNKTSLVRELDGGGEIQGYSYDYLQDEDLYSEDLDTPENDSGSESYRGSVDDEGESEAEDDEVRMDITYAQVAEGEDVQGVPWLELPFTREGYRQSRLDQYRNHHNMPQDEEGGHNKRAKSIREDGIYYKFFHNTRRVKCSIVHFQLRNLVWATSKHDVYLMYQNSVIHWDSLRRRYSPVLNLSGTRLDELSLGQRRLERYAGDAGAGFNSDAQQNDDLDTEEIEADLLLTGVMHAPPLADGEEDEYAGAGGSRNSMRSSLVPDVDLPVNTSLDDDASGRVVQISTMTVGENLLVTGGFFGEIVAKELSTGKILYNARITMDDNAITNSLDVSRTRSGAVRVMACSNDCFIRLFDIPSFTLLNKFRFDWAVNHATRQPNDGRLLCVVGDHSEVLLADADTGQALATLKGHKDFSFATSWHPNGLMFATGNQDCTARVWDIRHLKESLSVLEGHIGAMRSLRFSSDGRFLAMSEPADFVHIYEVRNGLFDRCQQIDLFGEIAGFSFSPSGESLYIGMSDRTYGSLLEYRMSDCTRKCIYL